MQEAVDEGENWVDEVIGKFIKRSESYNISLQLEVFI